MKDTEVLFLDEEVPLNKKGKKNIKKKLVIVLYLLLIAALSIYVIYDTLNKEEAPEPVIIETIDGEVPEEKYSFSFIGIGDALIHDGVYYAAQTYRYGSDGYMIYDFTKMLGYLKDAIKDYDLKYYNQETIIGGKYLGVSSYPCFNSPDEIALNMMGVGFNVISLATNHTMDKGITGALNNAKFFKSKDVVKAGNYVSQEDRNNIPIYSENGITYAFLNYTYGTNGIPVPNGYSYAVNVWPMDNWTAYSNYKAQVKKDIEQVRDKVDVVMVAMHWGTEYQVGYTNSYQQDAAKYLASLGVDVIIGTHPHVVQPITFIDDTLVIYSLGNFISSQTDDMNYAKRIGGVAAFTINKTVKGDETKISIDDVKADLIFTYHNASHTVYNVIPFSKMSNSYLYNYQSYYSTYLNYMNPNKDTRIQMGFIK